jgi:hypothetical protein
MHDNDGATYLEVVMLRTLDGTERAKAIAASMATPLQAADQDLDDMHRLRFWNTLIAYLLGVAEASVGADGREAIVQVMRNIPASSQLGRLQ